MTEYLDAAKNYTLVKDTAKRSEDWIEVPQGAIAMTKRGSFYKNKDGVLFFKGFNKDDWRLSAYTKISQINNLVWQRESLNDKVASAEVARQELKGVDATLADRQSTYGSFEDVSSVTQDLLSILKRTGYESLPKPHKEALHMICSKMARIVNGDSNHLDSWHDIGGYAKLIEDLIGEAS